MVKVSQLMKTDVFSVSPSHSFVSADQIMRLKHVRHVPVVESKRPVGLITHRELMRAQAKLMTEALTKTDHERVVNVIAKDFMFRDFLTCEPDTPAHEAARQMLAKNQAATMVVDDGKLVGILTATDMMAWAADVLEKAPELEDD